MACAIVAVPIAVDCLIVTLIRVIAIVHAQLVSELWVPVKVVALSLQSARVAILVGFAFVGVFLVRLFASPARL